MVDSLTSAATAATPVEKNASAQATTDFNTFLKLLTAQLQNQDPLDPTDGTEFTAQLAQFSTLEQQINTNTYLEDLIAGQKDPSQEVAMSYIGKDVLAKSSNISLSETGNIDFTYDIDTKVASTNVQIFNAEGEIVYDFAGSSAEGIHNVTWDGKDSDGKRLASGNYTIQVKADGIKSESGSETTKNLETYVYSRATEVVKLGDKYMVLSENGKYNELDDIIAAREASGVEPTSESKHATALQMLGKEILIPGNNFAQVQGQSKSFTYGITKDIQAVSITIKDADGNQILQVPFESSKGSHEYVWDGKDSNGNDVDSGDYRIDIKGQDIDSEGTIQEESLDTFYYGVAEKVEAQGNTIVLYTTDNRTAYYEEIISTREKS